jgi:thiol:disulfide interchange protein
MKNAGTWVRTGITAVLLGTAVWWLTVVAEKVGVPVARGVDGSVFDEFARAKDILLVVTPLLTTVLGYWFGSAGRQQAQNTADSARAEADLAHWQLAAVLDSSSQPNLLDKARKLDTGAFAADAQPNKGEQPGDDSVPPASAG